MKRAALFVIFLAVSTSAQSQWAGDAKKIRGIPVSPVRPTQGQTLVYNELQKMWVPQTPSGGAGFPLVDTGEKQDGYVGINQRYFPASSCTETAKCQIDLWKGTITSNAYDGVLNGVTLLDTQFIGATHWSYLSMSASDDTAGGMTVSFSAGGGGVLSTFDLRCVAFDGGGSPGASCDVIAGPGNVRVSSQPSDPLFGFFGQQKFYDRVSAPFGVFSVEASVSEAPDNTALASFHAANRGLPVTRKLFSIRTDDGEAVSVSAGGMVTLKLIRHTDLPACSDDRSGTLAYVMDATGNTNLKICRRTAGFWQWADL